MITSFYASALTFVGATLDRAVALATQARDAAWARLGGWVQENPTEAKAKASLVLAKACALRANSLRLNAKAAELSGLVARLPSTMNATTRADLITARDQVNAAAEQARTQAAGYAALAGVSVADLDRCAKGEQVEIGFVWVLPVVAIAALLAYAASVYRDVSLSDASLAMADKSIAAARAGINLRDVMPPPPPAPPSPMDPIMTVATIGAVGALAFGGWKLYQSTASKRG